MSAYIDRFLAAIRGVSNRDHTAANTVKTEPITYTEIDPDRRALDVYVAEGVSVTAPSVDGPIKVTGETVGENSAAYPTAANQVGRVAISIRNLGGQNDPIFIVNTIGTTEALADPDLWEIGGGETFNMDMNDANKIILVAEAGNTVDIQILEVRG